MVSVADAFAGWLVGLLADACRKRLITSVLGNEQERALRHVAEASILLTAQELSPGDAERAAELAAIIDQIFNQSILSESFMSQPTLVQELQDRIGAQVALLSDPDITGLGVSSATLLGVPAATVEEKLTSHILREIVTRGARGGPLAPLANQLNHDVTHLQNLQQDGVLGRLVDMVLQILARLDEVRATPMPALHALPADVAFFTGREAELTRLTDVLAHRNYSGSIAVAAIDGMAGVGKTAFAVHVAHQLAGRFPDAQLFVRLHGHTAGRQPVQPMEALATLLLTTGVAPERIPHELEQREQLWRDRMSDRQALLLLDDAISSEQVRPLLPGTSETLVLVTSRHRLVALPEAVTFALDTLKSSDAARLFVRVADRDELRPDSAAVKSIVSHCGYLPLAISLVASQLKHHSSWTAAYLKDELVTAADRLAFMRAEDLSVAAAFDLSYRTLSDNQRQLFVRLGLHPGADFDTYAAASLGGLGAADARGLLDGLFGYHLIEEAIPGRYHFHDLIRAFVSSLAAAEPGLEPDRVLGRLLDYYVAAARLADKHLALRTPIEALDQVDDQQAQVPSLSTRADAVTWMNAERLNLEAAARYAFSEARPDCAVVIANAMGGFLQSEGYWDQALIVHDLALRTARHIDNPLAEAHALLDLSAIHRLTGKYARATDEIIKALRLYRKTDNQLGEAYALHELGVVRFLTDRYPAAISILSRALNLFNGLGDQVGQASVLDYLGSTYRLAGNFPAATTSLGRALMLHRNLGDQNGEATALTHLAVVQNHTGEYSSALSSLHRALRLYHDLGSRNGEANAHYVLAASYSITGNHQAAKTELLQALALYQTLGSRNGEANALTDLGELYQLTGDYSAAAHNLRRALELFRELGHSLGTANVLNALGVLQYLTEDYEAADSDLTEALRLYRAIGNQYGEASALNELGKLSLITGTHIKARAFHEEALTLASTISAPLHRARALEGIGECQIQQGQKKDGAASLGQALKIYQEIKAPEAQRVKSILRKLTK